MIDKNIIDYLIDKNFTKIALKEKMTEITANHKTGAKVSISFDFSKSCNGKKINIFVNDEIFAFCVYDKNDWSVVISILDALDKYLTDKK